MRLTSEQDNSRPPFLIYVLSALPTFDCILNQLNNAFGIEIGSLSLLQVLRSLLLVVFGAVLLRKMTQRGAPFTVLHSFGFAGILLIVTALSKELVTTGSISMMSVGSYGQFAYWLVIGMLVASACRSRRDAGMILGGLAVGGLATALSIVAGYFLGGLNPYEEDNVSASAGWFHTAKTITGVLLTAAVVILYLGRQSTKWWPTLLAAFCAAACILTYARAGVVALAGVLLWFAFWWFAFGRNVGRQWISKLLLAVLLGGIFAPLLLKTESWQSRWEDVQDPDKAGSGRATFWKVALNAYASADPADQVFGLGYAKMADALLQGYGDDIRHTHNDFLDSMLVGGALGMGWLLLWFSFLAIRAFSLAPSTIEGAAAAAIVGIYLCHSQFTGQLFGTDSMTYYVTAFGCLFFLASAPSREPVHAPRLGHMPSFSPSFIVRS